MKIGFQPLSGLTNHLHLPSRSASPDVLDHFVADTGLISYEGLHKAATDYVPRDWVLGPDQQLFIGYSSQQDDKNYVASVRLDGQVGWEAPITQGKIAELSVSPTGIVGVRTDVGLIGLDGEGQTVYDYRFPAKRRISGPVFDEDGSSYFVDHQRSRLITLTPSGRPGWLSEAIQKLPVKEVARVGPAQLVAISDERLVRIDLNRGEVEELHCPSVEPGWEGVELRELSANPDGGVTALAVHHKPAQDGQRFIHEQMLFCGPDGEAWQSHRLSRSYCVESSHSVLNTEYIQIGNPTLTGAFDHRRNPASWKGGGERLFGCLPPGGKASRLHGSKGIRVLGPGRRTSAVRTPRLNLSHLSTRGLSALRRVPDSKLERALSFRSGDPPGNLFDRL